MVSCAKPLLFKPLSNPRRHIYEDQGGDAQYYAAVPKQLEPCQVAVQDGHVAPVYPVERRPPECPLPVGLYEFISRYRARQREENHFCAAYGGHNVVAVKPLQEAYHNAYKNRYEHEYQKLSEVDVAGYAHYKDHRYAAYESHQDAHHAFAEYPRGAADGGDVYGAYRVVHLFFDYIKRYIHASQHHCHKYAHVRPKHFDRRGLHPEAFDYRRGILDLPVVFIIGLKQLRVFHHFGRLVALCQYIGVFAGADYAYHVVPAQHPVFNGLIILVLGYIRKVFEVLDGSRVFTFYESQVHTRVFDARGEEIHSDGQKDGDKDHEDAHGIPVAYAQVPAEYYQHFFKHNFLLNRQRPFMAHISPYEKQERDCQVSERNQQYIRCVALDEYFFKAVDNVVTGYELYPQRVPCRYVVGEGRQHHANHQ